MGQTKIQIRRAEERDLDGITAIYDRVHENEAAGRTTIGWLKGIYPVRQTAVDALAREDLFVCEEGEKIVAAAVINQIQVPVYAEIDWKYKAEEAEVMVLHTLAVDPLSQGEGYGTAFVLYYERYAGEKGCTVLRMDTNARNQKARGFYERLGYSEAGIVPCIFNGIPDVALVCIEKKL